MADNRVGQDPDPVDYRERRWGRRRIMWRIGQQQRHQTCGRAARGDGVMIDVSTLADGSRRGTARGLVTCSSVWVCPVCSAHIRAGRAAEVAEGIDYHREAGGGLVFVTLTLRHSRADELEALLDALRSTWRKVQQSRGWRDRKGSLGIFGFVRSVEITYSSRAGWHPHLHLVLFTGRPLTHDQRDDLHDWLESAWIMRLRKIGRDAVKGPAVDVRRVVNTEGVAERLGGYTVKGESLHHEVSRSDLKSGRFGSISAMQLLDAAGDGEAWALRAWWEYERATHGVRAIEWSRGLRALVGLCEAEPEDEDFAADQFADGADVVDTVTVAHLTPFEWAAVAAAGWDYRLVNAYAGNEDTDPVALLREALERWFRLRGAIA